MGRLPIYHLGFQICDSGFDVHCGALSFGSAKAANRPIFDIIPDFGVEVKEKVGLAS
jgi:hypothetical protein